MSKLLTGIVHIKTASVHIKTPEKMKFAQIYLHHLRTIQIYFWMHIKVFSKSYLEIFYVRILSSMELKTSTSSVIKTNHIKIY